MFCKWPTGNDASQGNSLWSVPHCRSTFPLTNYPGLVTLLWKLSLIGLIVIGKLYRPTIGTLGIYGLSPQPHVRVMPRSSKLVRSIWIIEQQNKESYGWFRISLHQVSVSQLETRSLASGGSRCEAPYPSPQSSTSHTHSHPLVYVPCARQASRAEDPGFDSRLRHGNFSRST